MLMVHSGKKRRDHDAVLNVYYSVKSLKKCHHSFVWRDNVSYIVYGGAPSASSVWKQSGRTSSVRPLIM